MNNESRDVHVAPALQRQPGAAPLKNEKPALLCCSQNSPLSKNPIKTKEGHFSFQRDDTWRATPVRSEMGAADEVGEGFFWGRGGPEGEGVIDRLSQQRVSCTLSITGGPSPFVAVFFSGPPVTTRFRNTPQSLWPHLTSLLRG